MIKPTLLIIYCICIYCIHHSFVYLFNKSVIVFFLHLVTIFKSLSHNIQIEVKYLSCFPLMTLTVQLEDEK